MDEKIKQSFRKLKHAVLKDVQKKAEEQSKNIENETERILSKKRTEFTAEADKKVASEISKAQHKLQSEILDFDMKTKRSLILQREKLVNSLFEDVEKKLCDYRQTEEYVKLIYQKAQIALEICGNGSIVYARTDDAEKLSGIDIKQCDILGGIKAENRENGIIADFSFEIMLEEARAEFLKTGGLTIEI